MEGSANAQQTKYKLPLTAQQTKYELPLTMLARPGLFAPAWLFRRAPGLVRPGKFLSQHCYGLLLLLHCAFLSSPRPAPGHFRPTYPPAPCGPPGCEGYLCSIRKSFQFAAWRQL